MSLLDFRKGAQHHNCSDIVVEVPKENELKFQYFGAKANGGVGEPINSGKDGNGNPIHFAPGLIAMTQAGEMGVDAVMVLNAKKSKSDKKFQLIWFNQDKKLENNVGNGKPSGNPLNNSDVKTAIEKMEKMVNVYTKQFKLDPKRVVGVFDVFSDRPAPDKPNLHMEPLVKSSYVITRGEAFDKAAGPVFGPLIKRTRMEGR